MDFLVEEEKIRGLKARDQSCSSPYIPSGVFSSGPMSDHFLPVHHCLLPNGSASRSSVGALQTCVLRVCSVPSALLTYFVDKCHNTNLGNAGGTVTAFPLAKNGNRNI